MAENWVKIYSNAYLYKVTIAQSVLAEQGIESVILNKQDTAYGMFGSIELYANKENAMRAVNLIKEIKFETDD